MDQRAASHEGSSESPEHPVDIVHTLFQSMKSQNSTILQNSVMITEFSNLCTVEFNNLTHFLILASNYTKQHLLMNGLINLKAEYKIPSKKIKTSPKHKQILIDSHVKKTIFSLLGLQNSVIITEFCNIVEFLLFLDWFMSCNLEGRTYPMKILTFPC